MHFDICMMDVSGGEKPIATLKLKVSSGKRNFKDLCSHITLVLVSLLAR